MNVVKMRPTWDNVVVRRDEAAAKTKGGIILPDGSAKERPRKGVVLAVGPTHTIGKDGRNSYPTCELKAGMKVVFNGYAGNEIEVDGEKLVILAATEILAVLE